MQRCIFQATWASGRPDIDICQFQNAVEGLRYMGPEGDEYHEDVEVPLPQSR